MSAVSDGDDLLYDLQQWAMRVPLHVSDLRKLEQRVIGKWRRPSDPALIRRMQRLAGHKHSWIYGTLTIGSKTAGIIGLFRVRKCKCGRTEYTRL